MDTKVTPIEYGLVNPLAKKLFDKYKHDILVRINYLPEIQDNEFTEFAKNDYLYGFIRCESSGQYYFQPVNIDTLEKAEVGLPMETILIQNRIIQSDLLEKLGIRLAADCIPNYPPAVKPDDIDRIIHPLQFLPNKTYKIYTLHYRNGKRIKIQETTIYMNTPIYESMVSRTKNRHNYILITRRTQDYYRKWKLFYQRESGRDSFVYQKWDPTTNTYSEYEVAIYKTMANKMCEMWESMVHSIFSDENRAKVWPMPINPIAKN